MKTFFEMPNGIMVPVRMSLFKTGEISFLLLIDKDDPSISQAIGVMEHLIVEAEEAGFSFEKLNLNLPEGDRPDQVRFRLFKKEKEDNS